MASTPVALDLEAGLGPNFAEQVFQLPRLHVRLCEHLSIYANVHGLEFCRCMLKCGLAAHGQASNALWIQLTASCFMHNERLQPGSGASSKWRRSGRLLLQCSCILPLLRMHITTATPLVPGRADWVSVDSTQVVQACAEQLFQPGGTAPLMAALDSSACFVAVDSSNVIATYPLHSWSEVCLPCCLHEHHY